MNTMPKYVADTIAALLAERSPMGARLDAIDLALDNLRRVWPEADLRGGGKQPSSRRRLHVVRDGGKSAAVTRRALLLTVISKSSDGLTLAELRAQTPKMADKDRSNALTTLKAQKQIRRAGKTWIAA